MKTLTKTLGILGIAAMLFASAVPAFAASKPAAKADAASTDKPVTFKRGVPIRGGGFHGPSIPPITVEQAKKLNDDARVVLRGSLVQRIGADEYTFKDASGTVTVEIEDKHWKGQMITPEDTVEIFGKVDKDRGEGVKIEAKRIFKR